MNSNNKLKKSVLAKKLKTSFLLAVTIFLLPLNGHAAAEKKAKTKSSAKKTETLKLINPQEPLIANKVVQLLKVPDISTIPKDQYGESVLRGKDYMEHTFEKLPQFVGAKIHCTSCHLNSGMTAFAGPWIGVTGRFPKYRSRSAKVDTLMDRINDCFERSLNGTRLPIDSPEMTDILSYMTWLSKGYAIGQNVEGSGIPKLILDRTPDLDKGHKVFLAKCASCHQNDGYGLYAKNDRETTNGKMIYPALWGEKSFNVGAGMAKHHTAAGFIKKNMPFGQGNTLSDDEAWDVAAFVLHQDRPDFKKKHQDWLKGDKPIDANY